MATQCFNLIYFSRNFILGFYDLFEDISVRRGRFCVNISFDITYPNYFALP